MVWGFVLGRALTRNSNAGPCQGPNKCRAADDVIDIIHAILHVSITLLHPPV